MATSTITPTAKQRRVRSTNVGLKLLMAVTGFVFVFFVLFHMYGNLKIFAGPEAYNGYALGLREFLMPILPYEGFLWIFRIVLLACLIGHVYSAAKLWKAAKRARGSKYAVDKRTTQTYSARTMRWGGIILLTFIIFHLLQYTVLAIQVGGNYHEMTPYDRMMVGFNSDVWYMWIVYFIAVLMLSMHVRHGVWSALATLGLSSKKREKAFNILAYACGAALLIGFMTPPTAILFGLIP